MLTDEEREQIDLACIADWKRGWSGIHPDRDNINAAVESIVAARVRAPRAQERQQVIDELHEFLPEWNYPAHVIAAISLELKDRANHIESSQNG